MKKNILVTGGLGFIGFNFIKYIIENDLPYNITNIDCRTYAAKYCINEKLSYFSDHYIDDHELDICIIDDIDDIEEILIEKKIDIIINFAAESHVDNSINNPSIFLDTNIYGVLNLLELCKKHKIRFHQVSTDEVYGPVDPYKDNVDENFKYNPSSPYSVSKTSADLLVLSYIRTYNINATISRCTNNFGPYQHPEKLIPKVITNVFNNIKIPVYGDGKQIRNWIYVDDHCQGILSILEKGKLGEIYNIGSDTLIPNIDVIKEILNQLKKSNDLISYVIDRPGHDFAYHLNSNKIKNETGWKELNSFSKNLTKTIEWYKEHENCNNR